MTTHQFETLEPVDLYVENGSGSVTITADDTTETTVEVTGKHADEAIVTQNGKQISVIAPKMRSGFLGGDTKLDMAITVPTDSTLAVKTGSADVSASGSYRGGQVKSGSGQVTIEILDGPAVLETGSGDIRVDTADQELRVKSGSGDVRVQYAGGEIAVSTGSGDVEIGTSNAPAVVKTGSGDLNLGESRDDVTMSTGSGDLVIRTAHRGQLTAKGASGDVQIGIPAGVPVWTDLTTVSGDIRSGLEGVGEPEEGADHIELRAKTVSGDIVLTQV
ncbi:MAG TPA: DUF4097 family beta strand repeat-containing protein [Nocardioides sp.]|nr:DUF4097 family beta strand repeat-containing protein [Nocardioides sp.]